MVRVLEQLDVLLKVLQIELLFRLVEQGLIGFHGLKARRLLLKLQDLCFGLLHSRVKLDELTVAGVETSFVVDLHVFKTLAVVCQPLGMLNDQFVAVIDLCDKDITLAFVS